MIDIAHPGALLLDLDLPIKINGHLLEFRYHGFDVADGLPPLINLETA
jgi:hypothetical protein